MSAYYYQTNKKHKMLKKRLFANSQKNDWISTVTLADKPITDCFTGFGVAITGSSCYELSVMHKDRRDAFLSDIYGKSGLNLSVARVSMGSSDYSTSVYSYCDTPGDAALKTFSIDMDKEFILPMLREAVKHNPELKFLASPWSPPGWMKTGGLISNGYMRDKYTDCYADYFIKFIKAYQDEGIKISYITPQNEPEAHQMGKSVACIWSPDTEAKFIIELKEKLKQNNIDTQIWMYDHCFIGWPRILWTLKEYPKLEECVDSIALHYYDGGIELVDNITNEFPEMKWEFTEGGPRLYDNYDSDWIKWSFIIARSLAHGCGSFFGWNLILDEDGGPNVGPFGCGGLATLDSQSGEIAYSGQYHAFRHFSSLMQRGAKIYPVNISENYSWVSAYPKMTVPIEAAAAVNPDGSHILTAVNTNDSKHQAQYFYNNKWWYLELMPQSVSSFVFPQN